MSRPLQTLLAALLLSPLGCHGQAISAGSSARLTPELARRVEVLIRARGGVPPDFLVSMGPLTASEVPGYNQVAILFTNPDGSPNKPVNFLVSDDGKTLAQFSRYDISKDPRLDIPDGNRPARGGPESAPVTIVGFDDLECPFCAKLHAQIFPALLERYGTSVHFVYRDYPLPNHPWAMRAAIDVNCLGEQSITGYWNLVDHIHAHAAELGGPEKSVDVANHTLDTLTLDEGKLQRADATKLNACIQKQDPAIVEASVHAGEALGLNSTPTLFINGEKFEGAYPSNDLFRMIDGALIAQGRTPPPAPAATAAAPTTTCRQAGQLTMRAPSLHPPTLHRPSLRPPPRHLRRRSPAAADPRRWLPSAARRRRRRNRQRPRHPDLRGRHRLPGTAEREPGPAALLRPG